MLYVIGRLGYLAVLAQGTQAYVTRSVVRTQIGALWESFVSYEMASNIIREKTVRAHTNQASVYFAGHSFS
jgi:hypothetical protein